MGNAMLMQPCLDCGRTEIVHHGRGLCGRCYMRRVNRGRDFADRPPVSQPDVRGGPLPATRGQLAAACDRADAALRREIRRRMVAGESLVLAHDWTAHVAPTDEPHRVAAG